MNPLYNNRTYYISNVGDGCTFEKLFKDIAFDGSSAQGTREFANTRIVVTDADKKDWCLSFDHVKHVVQLLKSIWAQDGNMINDVYDSQHYLFLNDEIKKVREQFREDCVATRRAVFAFPSTHCFDSIQILVRDGEVIITINMRSCNAYKNLACDLFLAQRLALEATNEIATKGVHLIANIGSLHLFKEDIKNVL